jgi:hypothetical protein
VIAAIRRIMCSMGFHRPKWAIGGTYCANCGRFWTQPPGERAFPQFHSEFLETYEGEGFTCDDVRKISDELGSLGYISSVSGHLVTQECARLCRLSSKFITSSERSVTGGKKGYVMLVPIEPDADCDALRLALAKWTGGNYSDGSSFEEMLEEYAE